MDQPQPDEKMTMIPVYMPPQLIAALEALGPNRSDTIRTACMMFVAQQTINREAAEAQQ